MPADAVTNNQGGPGKFFDLGNLQVLKGSQGTLFGRNTTGGALVLEPNMPRPEFSASMRAGTSNYNRSEEHTSELQSLMRISYAVFCLKKKNRKIKHKNTTQY